MMPDFGGSFLYKAFHSKIGVSLTLMIKQFSNAN